MPENREVNLRDDTRELRFTGAVLGVATSQRLDHTDHRGEFAPRGDRCGACRWLEVTIYRRRPADDYVVHTVGRSIVPGEFNLPRIAETDSPYEVVEILTVRRSAPDGEVFMPPQHARALAAASQHDEGIRDAYVNRAVV